MSEPQATGGDRFLISFRSGEYVFREGDTGSELFIVHEGKVEIVASSEVGERRFAILEKGDFFGEMSLLEDLPRNASAKALTEVKLVRVDRTRFDRMLRRDPEIAVRIMRKLSRRLRDADRLLRRDTLEVSAEEIDLDEIPSSVHRLIHRGTKRSFDLPQGAELRIGRSDPVTGILPEIDLSPVDPERSISRRHATIYRREGVLYLVEDIGTTNGTWVDSERLDSGVPVRIAAGNVLRFGLVDLDLLSG
jgi:CRP-like cAMP-binding protein